MVCFFWCVGNYFDADKMCQDKILLLIGSFIGWENKRCKQFQPKIDISKPIQPKKYYYYDLNSVRIILSKVPKQYLYICIYIWKKSLEEY